MYRRVLYQGRADHRRIGDDFRGAPEPESTTGMYQGVELQPSPLTRNPSWFSTYYASLEVRGPASVQPPIGDGSNPIFGLQA